MYPTPNRSISLLDKTRGACGRVGLRNAPETREKGVALGLDLLPPGIRKAYTPPISRGINGFFAKRGWRERSFKIEVTVDGEVTLAPTHHVDYFKNRVAIETEWNNKDPFYDRDLTTFRLLFELNVLSVGVIITRGDDLQNIFDKLGKGASYGASTTHMSKLKPKMDNRASGGCPVLAFGMTAKLYDPRA